MPGLYGPGEGGSGPGSSRGSGGSGAPPAGGLGGSGGGSSVPVSLTGSPSLLGAVARALPTVVVTTGGVSMAMAFLVFGKRRRDEEQPAPDDVLAAEAARGAGTAPPAALAGSLRTEAAVASAVQAAAVPVPGVVDPDGHMPRWRRPSLMEARKADPTRGAGAASVRLTFTGDVGTAVTGLERRLIRYRLVSLLDQPDEVRGVEIGVLDEGDEVVLMEKRGTYWRVLCPDGRQGWLHKMTLGDTVIDPSTQPGDSWTSGDDGPIAGGFEDILRAYTEQRRQFGEA